jgi:hypothetical protein
MSTLNFTDLLFDYYAAISSILLTYRGDGKACK